MEKYQFAFHSENKCLASVNDTHNEYIIYNVLVIKH